MSTPANAVLVGYDGSGDSELALSWAIRVAEQRRLPLRVLVSEIDPTSILELTSEWHAAKMAQLEKDAGDRTRNADVPAVAVDLTRDPPAVALIDASAEAALVVVGARGHSRLSGVLLGSVSQHVARHASCPVVVARQPYDPSSTRVVVGVDGSGGSREALEFAFDHADRIGGDVTVLHGWRSLSRGGSASLDFPFDGYSDELRVAERVLAESVAGFSERYPDVMVSEEAIPVAPSRALADASHAAALVVVGSRGRGAFAGMLLGSVSQAVLTHAECPVAVVR